MVRNGSATAGRSLAQLLIVAAFLSSGAWMIVGLPPIPIAKALQLATVGVWLLVFGSGAVDIGVLDRRVAVGIAAALAAVAVAYLAGGALLQVAVYDLFAEMPLVQWLAFPAVFALAASLRVADRELSSALSWVIAIGALLAAVMAYQQATTGANFVFGSTGYSITALAPLIPVAAGVAVMRRGAGRALLYGAAVLIAAALALGSGSMTGAATAAFATVLAVAVVAHAGAGGLRRGVVWIAAVLAGVLFVGLVLAQIPAVSGRWVNADSIQPYGKNLVSRVYLWEGAQRMFAERPLVGFGPSGYRTAAVEYLDPQALQYGADVAGNTDPTVYSPQSPHSVIWEIATRLGVLGLIAFAALFACWSAALLRPRVPNRKGDVWRWALAAGFLASLFAMLVNPVIFAIGLFPATAAGLAVAPVVTAGTAKGKAAPPHGETATRTRMQPVLAAAGVAVMLLAVWLGVGESRGSMPASEQPAAALADYEAALRILPGHPMALRHALELRLLLAPDAESVAIAQREIDRAPAWMAAYRPNLVNFAAYSLTQAQRTARTDVAWERRMLSSAEEALPPIPSLVSEELHLAVVSGDKAAMREALPAAYRWGRPYPLVETYIREAEAVVGEQEDR